MKDPFDWFFGLVIFSLGLILALNLVAVAVEHHLKGEVFACAEVTKNDPVNVQKICKRAWRPK